MEGLSEAAGGSKVRGGGAGLGTAAERVLVSLYEFIVEWAAYKTQTVGCDCRPLAEGAMFSDWFGLLILLFLAASVRFRCWK